MAKRVAGVRSTTLERSMGHHAEILQTSRFGKPAPDKDDKFNAWYDQRHLGDMLKIPRFFAATRFRMLENLTSDSIYRYCAIYELDSDDPSRSIAEMQVKAGTAEMPICGSTGTHFYGALFEEIISSTRQSVDVANDRVCKPQ